MLLPPTLLPPMAPPPTLLPPMAPPPTLLPPMAPPPTLPPPTAPPPTPPPPRSRATSRRAQTVKARSPVHNQPLAIVRSSPQILLQSSRSRRLPHRPRRPSRSRQRRRRSRGPPRQLSQSRRRTSHNCDPRPAAKWRALRLKRNLVLHLRPHRGLRLHARPPAVYPYGTRRSR